MKILIAITNSFCANFIKGQAKFLKEQGHEVIIVSAFGEEIKKLIDEEHPIYYNVPFVKDISILQDLKCLFTIFKIIRNERPDIVNAGNPKPGFLFSLISVLFPRIAFVFTLRGLRSDTLNGLKKRIVFFTEKITCYFVDKVIVISPSLLNHAVDLKILKKSKGVVINFGSSNGIDVEKFSLDEYYLKKGRDFRKKHGMDINSTIFLFVGRINNDKGILELFNAFQKINCLNKKAKLIIAGPIEQDDAITYDLLNKIIRNEDILFLGKVEDVQEVYAASNVLILYSRREGFGNVVIEASSMSLATIVADIPGLKDTTEHMRSGIIVKPNSIEDLAKAMLFYIEQPHYIRQHGKYGSKRVLKYFSSQIIHKGLLKIYEKTINNK